MSRKNPVRSSQIVSPYGIGGMILHKGISIIICGQDSWFPSKEVTVNNFASGKNLEGHLYDESEFIIRESRLEMRLGVCDFRKPPDYR